MDPYRQEKVTQYVNNAFTHMTLDQNTTVTSELVFSCIKSLTNGKAPGPDNIANEHLKYGVKSLARPFADHRCCDKETFMIKWRKVILSPYTKFVENKGMIQTATRHYVIICSIESIWTRTSPPLQRYHIEISQQFTGSTWLHDDQLCIARVLTHARRLTVYGMMAFILNYWASLTIVLMTQQ